MRVYKQAEAYKLAKVPDTDFQLVGIWLALIASIVASCSIAIDSIYWLIS